MTRLVRTPRGLQLPLPGTPAARSKTPVVEKVSEADVQGGIVDGLRWHGLEVLVTSRHLQRCRCAQCGHWHWPSFSDHASRGVPDLLVRRSEDSRFGRAWGSQAVWLGMEVKGVKTRLSPEQQDLSRRGCIVVVRSLEEALRVVEAVDRQMGGGA